jgi:hypothetical protein
MVMMRVPNRMAADSCSGSSAPTLKNPEAEKSQLGKESKF